MINISLLKYVNTGDRMLDTTLQMIFTTIVSAILSVIIVSTTNPDLIKGYLRYFKLMLGYKHDPLDFNPSFAPKKSKNPKGFLFKTLIREKDKIKTFVSWFYTNVVNRPHQVDNLTRSIRLPGPGRNTLEYKAINASAAGTYLDYDVYFPIWYSKNGEWVYYNSGGDYLIHGIDLFSDSAEAIYECMEHIEAHQGKMKDYEMKKGRGGSNEKILYEVETGKEGVVSNEVSKIPANRVFDKLFFDQKDKILPVLEAFKEKKLVPANLPIDNKLGILLHGPPGTGKTGFISALANFLDRDILLCDMSKIKTRAQLTQLFSDHKNEQFLFVFEEFDTMPGVCKRESGASVPHVEPNATSNPAFAMMLMAEKEKSEVLKEIKNDMAEAKDKIDLGFLLRKLDGLESGEDRIIIATTNHPERIDPALLRPGRFGLHLNLGNCSHSMLEKILEMGCPSSTVLKGESSDLSAKVSEIPQGKWSPAFVIQTCLEFNGDIEKVVEALKK